MLKNSSTKSAKSRNGGIGVDCDSKAGRDKNEINKNGMNDVEVDGGKVRDDEIGKKDLKTFKSKNLSKSKKTVKLDFFIPGARLAFIKLR